MGLRLKPVYARIRRLRCASLCPSPILPRDPQSGNVPDIRGRQTRVMFRAQIAFSANPCALVNFVGLITSFGL